MADGLATLAEEMAVDELDRSGLLRGNRGHRRFMKATHPSKVMCSYCLCPLLPILGVSFEPRKRWHFGERF